MTDLAAPLADGGLTDQELTGMDLTEMELTDEELTELALAADPSAPLAGDAVPLDVHLRRLNPGALNLLPSWYMAPVIRSVRKRRYRIAVAAVVAAFVTIDLFGLCSTYGPLVLA